MGVKRSSIWLVSDDVLIEAVEKGSSFVDVLKEIGMRPVGRNHEILKARLIASGIDTTELQKRKLEKQRKHLDVLSSKQRIPIEAILVENSSYSRDQLKTRLIKSNLIRNVCAECGLEDSWNNKPLVLEIDHINGIYNDNRIVNLRLLCPNCHSQTATDSGRNIKRSVKKTVRQCKNCYRTFGVVGKRKLCDLCFSASRRFVAWPAKEELEKLIWELTSEKIGAMYNVSGVSVGKWCRKYGISKPPRGYWQQLKFGKIPA